MKPSEAHSLLQEGARRIDWTNIGRIIDSLARGHPWKKYDKTYWKPNFKRAEIDLPWLLDNMPKLCEAVEVLRREHDGREDSSKTSTV